MRKGFALITALAASTAVSAPLLGTSQSVALGNFCKEYACDLASTLQLEAGAKLFNYRLKNGLTLEIIRQADKSISSAAVAGQPALLRGAVSTAFTRSFLGLTLETSIVNRCINRANPVSENSAFKGVIGGKTYSVFCEQPAGSSPVVAFGAQFTQP